MKPLYITSIFAAASLLLGGCSDNDKWQPGPEEAATIGVYFENLANYDILVLDDEDRQTTVTLGRVNSENAASVPLKVISCPEGVTVPATVEFAAGEETASFEVSMKDMPLSTSGLLTVQIDPAYSSAYAAGTSEMNLNITVSGGWKVLADDLVIDYDQNTMDYPNENSVLYILDGTKRFKIENFQNSGVDFIFTVDDPSLSRPRIVPYTNCIWYAELFPDSDDTYHCWYLYDTATDTYPQWSPDGSQPEITYMMFYGYDSSSTYSYFQLEKGYAYISSSVDYSNGKYGYGDCELYFTAKYNPFN